MLLVNERALEREIDKAVDDIAGERRDLSQQQLAARGRLQDPEHLVNCRIGFVDLVDKQKARNFLIFELAQDQLKLRHLLLVELADHDGRIDCRQRPAHVMDEFNRTGTINKRISIALEISTGHGELDAHFVVTRFLAAVADRVLGIDSALALNRAGAGEDRFEQRRLAALERAHQRDAPWTRSSCAVLCHLPPPIVTETRSASRPFELSFQAGGGLGKRRRIPRTSARPGWTCACCMPTKTAASRG